MAHLLLEFLNGSSRMEQVVGNGCFRNCQLLLDRPDPQAFLAADNAAIDAFTASQDL